MLTRIFAAAVFALLALTAPANAATLDPAVGETLTFEAYTGAPVITNFGIPSATNTVYHYGGSASALISQGGTMLSAQATEGRVDGFGDGLPTQGQADLTYSFEIVGPSSLNPVPLSLQANLSGIGDLGTASLTLQYTQQNPAYLLVAIACGGGCIPGYQSHVSVNQQLSVTPNQPIKVQEQASAATDGTYTAQALIDPYFTIDPSFLAANPGYSLEFSPGIDNEPLATPLPAALPLFGSGVMMLAGFAVRRRGKVSA
jgi:hypothetical protein